MEKSDSKAAAAAAVAIDTSNADSYDYGAITPIPNIFPTVTALLDILLVVVVIAVV